MLAGERIVRPEAGRCREGADEDDCQSREKDRRQDRHREARRDKSNETRGESQSQAGRQKDRQTGREETRREKAGCEKARREETHHREKARTGEEII